MEKSKLKAFTFMFKDSDCKYKLFILSSLAFPTAFLSYQGENLKQIMKGGLESALLPVEFILVLLILTVACTFLFEGYCCKCTQLVIYANQKDPEKDLLPKWENEFWEYSKIGVAFSIGVSLIGLAVALGSILIVPLLFYAVAYVALKTLFCVNFKMSEFFAWKKALKLMRNNFGHYISVILYSIGVYIVFGIIAYLCSLSYFLVFVGAFVQAYFYLVLAYLRGTLFTTNPEVFFAIE